MNAKQIAKKIKAKGLGRLKWYCQMCQKQCRDENGFKCHTRGESHLRQMELVSQNPSHYLDQLSNQFEESFLKLLSRRFNTTSVAANKVYNEYIQDKEHSHMNATKWETLSGFIQYLGRTGKVKVEESDKGLYITWIDRNPEAMARAEKNAKRNREAMGDMTLNEKLMKQRLAIAKTASGGSETAAATSRNNNVSGVQVDSEGNIVLGIGGSSDGSSTSSNSRKRSATDGRPTLMFGGSNHRSVGVVVGGGSSSNSSSSSTTTSNSNVPPPALANTTTNNTTGTTTASNSIRKATISFEMAPPAAKRARHEAMEDTKEPRSIMWMCESLVVKIKNKTVGNGIYYKKKARILKCNVDALTADVRVLDSTRNSSDTVAGTKIRISQHDLETVIPKPNMPDGRSKVMLLRGKYRGMLGNLVALNLKKFSCNVELEDNNEIIHNIEYEDVSKVLVIDPYKKKQKKKKKKKNSSEKSD
jgi:DNA/RNA-binding protein KIN17